MPGAARRGQRAAAAVIAATTLLFTAIGPAALGERLGELAKLGLGFVGVGQRGGELLDFGANRAQKIEEQRFAVEQVLDIDEHRVEAALLDERGAGLVGGVARPFEAIDDQLIVGRDAAEQLAVGHVGGRIGFRDSQRLAHLEPARGAANDRVAPGEMPGRAAKAANLADLANANDVQQRHWIQPPRGATLRANPC